MTVNPKKLRPYDEPPKRRRALIPDRPGSAAIGFLVAALLWFAVATGLAALAVGLRIVGDVALSQPLGVFDLSFEFDARRVDYAFLNATVYGWLSNAGLAAVCFITPRLFGRSLVGEKGASAAIAIWNLSVLGGMATLYLFDLGPHEALTAFPWLIDGGMALALLMVSGSFVATAGPEIRTGYVSAWYLAAAILGFLALTAANAALSFLPLEEIPTLLASAFVSRAIETMWLLGVALAALHYVVPHVAGRPLHSAGAAMLGWLGWLLLAPVSGLAALIDTSVPYAITSIGSAATMMLLAPVTVVVVTLLLTLRDRLWLLFSATPVAFAVVALAFLLGTALLQAIGALRSVQEVVGATEWSAGVLVFGLLGTYTLAALALSEHALPRLLRRAWGGGIWSSALLWTAFAGAALGGLALMAAGLAEGSMIADAAPPDVLQATLVPYRAAAVAGLGLSALAGLVAVANAFLLYASAEPESYVVPGTASPAAAGH